MPLMGRKLTARNGLSFLVSGYSFIQTVESWLIGSIVAQEMRPTMA